MQEIREKILINTNDFLREKFSKINFKENKVLVFNDVVKEYDLLRYGTGIRVLSSKAILKLDGKDSLDFLHRISTNDVKTLELNQIKDTIFTNEKGRILDFTKLINTEKGIYLIGGLNNNNILESWLNRYIIMEDIKVTDVTDEYIFLEFFGTQAESFLIMQCGKLISDSEEHSFHSIEFLGKKVYFYKNLLPNGQFKFTIIINNGDIVEVIEQLINDESVFDYGFVGDEAYDIFRIENMIVRFPNEINHNVNPHEVELLDAVSFTKGCYIGQEVIARLDTYDKVQRVLKRFQFDENVVVDSLPFEIFNKNDEESGFITSYINSELLKKNIGLALVRKKNIDEDLFIINGKDKVKLNFNR